VADRLSSHSIGSSSLEFKLLPELWKETTRTPKMFFVWQKRAKWRLFLVEIQEKYLHGQLKLEKSYKHPAEEVMRDGFSVLKCQKKSMEATKQSWTHRG
jgi:hypothetical protein